jgi:hypothetical protein
LQTLIDRGEAQACDIHQVLAVAQHVGGAKAELASEAANSACQPSPVDWPFCFIHLRQVFEKTGLSDLIRAKTNGKGGF